MNTRLISVIAFVAFLGIALFAPRAPTTFAQSPTEEPTKRPYAFPTPVFIPTYPNDTLQPPLTRVVLTATLSTTIEQPSGDQTYTVQPNDSLWIIAQKVYGNGAKYPLIANANDITTTTHLRTGMVLKIPSAPGLATVTPTRAPPMPPATFVPAATPTPASPTPTRSATASALIPASIAGTASTAINILGALFALASLVSAVLAYLAFARARRLKRIEEGKPPLRFR